MTNKYEVEIKYLANRGRKIISIVKTKVSKVLELANIIQDYPLWIYDINKPLKTMSTIWGADFWPSDHNQDLFQTPLEHCYHQLMIDSIS